MPRFSRNILYAFMCVPVSVSFRQMSFRWQLQMFLAQDAGGLNLWNGGVEGWKGMSGCSEMHKLATFLKFCSTTVCLSCCEKVSWQTTELLCSLADNLFSSIKQMIWLRCLGGNERWADTWKLGCFYQYMAELWNYWNTTTSSHFRTKNTNQLTFSTLTHIISFEIIRIKNLSDIWVVFSLR